MTAFDRFTVCGLHDVTMTSLRRVADATGTAMPTEPSVRAAVATALGATPPPPPPAARPGP
jgi:lipoyl(octanoyl) transferase